MEPFVVNGDVWRVAWAAPGDPSLMDRTGHLRLATADPAAKVIRISTDVTPPLLDKVLLHEVAHAITISHGLLDALRTVLPEDLWVFVEEWSAQLVENHSIEAALAAAESLGRPLCIRGYCMVGWPHGVQALTAPS